MPWITRWKTPREGMNFSYKHALRKFVKQGFLCFLLDQPFVGTTWIYFHRFKKICKPAGLDGIPKIVGCWSCSRDAESLPHGTRKNFKLLPDGTKMLEAVDFFSMVAGPSERSRLVKVTAMEPGFPFHGSFHLNLKAKLIILMIFYSIRNRLHGFILNFQSTQSDLGDHPLGKSKFLISDIVKEDAGLQFQPAEFAPKLYISRNFLEETDLLQEETPPFAIFFSFTGRC